MSFQKEGLMVAKSLVWAKVVLTRRTNGNWQSKDRSGRCEIADRS